MPDRFGGSGPSPVPAGGTLTIKFKNPSLANTTITVGLSNGGSADATVSITLDANGTGSTTWTVPKTGWDLVILSQTTSEDHTIPVSHGDDIDGAFLDLATARSETQATNAAGAVFLMAQRSLAALESAAQREGPGGRHAKLYLAKLYRRITS